MEADGRVHMRGAVVYLCSVSTGLLGRDPRCFVLVTEAPQAKQVLEFSYWPTHNLGVETRGPFLWVATRGPYLGVCHPWVIPEEPRGPRLGIYTRGQKLRVKTRGQKLRVEPHETRPMGQLPMGQPPMGQRLRVCHHGSGTPGRKINSTLSS